MEAKATISRIYANEISHVPNIPAFRARLLCALLGLAWLGLYVQWHHTASNTNRKGSIITSGAIGGTQRPRSLKSLRCPEREREREGLHAVGHDSILIGIVVSDLGRSSCRPLSLSSPLSCPPSFSRPYLPRNEHRIDFHLGWLPLATGSRCPMFIR